MGLRVATTRSGGTGLAEKPPLVSVAQLGEHLAYTQKVRGSNPRGDTMEQKASWVAPDRRTDPDGNASVSGSARPVSPVQPGHLVK